MAVAVNSKNSERRNKVFLGPLAPDFLRVSVSAQQQQEAIDQQAAVALQQQLYGPGIIPNAIGRLSITVVQAKLVKNYGIISRMDPYMRLRVGHYVYETPTDNNGGKTPRWNKTIHCFLPNGVDQINVEIYDECSFTTDELIAWANIPIPKNVMAGETHEDWYPLSGKQGDGLEGEVNLVFSYAAFPPNANPYAAALFGPPSVIASPVTYGKIPKILPITVAPTPASQINQHDSSEPEPLELSEEELKQIVEMFPNISTDVIKSIFSDNHGNKERTINVLLQMQD